MEKKDMFDVVVGELIAKARKEKGISQRDLAKAIRIPRGSISNWEIGRAPMPLSKARLICDYLGLDIDEVANIAWERSKQ